MFRGRSFFASAFAKFDSGPGLVLDEIAALTKSGLVALQDEIGFAQSAKQIRPSIDRFIWHLNSTPTCKGRIGPSHCSTTNLPLRWAVGQSPAAWRRCLTHELLIFVARLPRSDFVPSCLDRFSRNLFPSFSGQSLGPNLASL